MNNFLVFIDGEVLEEQEIFNQDGQCFHELVEVWEVQ